MKTELIVALDYATSAEAGALIRALRGTVKFYKVGLRLHTAEGERPVKLVKDAGFEVFLDLKFHDIPQTVADAVGSTARLGVYATSLHLSGGLEMLQAAAAVRSRPLLWGISVLTSQTLEDPALVTDLARTGMEAGIDGVVCSGREAALVAGVDPRPQIIVPGVRPAGEAANDQKRVVTPAEAARRGADFIVVGRPITAAQDPLGAARRILEELQAEASKR